MRLFLVVLVGSMLVSACAALKRTESLPSPAGAIQGGPEGEDDYSSGYY
jgi:hypothetical protein